MLSSAGGFIAANIVGAISSQVSDFVGSIGKVTADEQDQMAQLQAGLTSTGGKAGVTIDMLQQLAHAQADQTKFSVAQTEAIEKVGLTFTSINKSVFPQTVQLAEDMSQRLGIQGSAAMTMLGKAADDPIKGMTALHKTGTSFTEQQIEQIKALTASGDKLGAYQIILHEVAAEYGGSATAAAATFSGQQEILAHKMDEVKVKIGTAVLPILGELTGFIASNVVPILSTFADWFAAKLPVAIETAKSVIGSVSAALQPFIEAWSTASGTTSNFAEDVGYAIDTLTGWQGEAAGPFQQAIQTVIGLFKSAGDSSSQLGKMINDLSGIWTALQPVIANVTNAIGQLVLAVFGQIQTFLHAHGADIAATMQDAWARIMVIIKLGIELYNAIVPPVLKAIAGFIKAHGTEIQAILSTTWNSIKATIDAVLTLIEGVIKVALDLIHGNWSQAWEDLKTMSARLVLDIWTIIKGGLDNVVTVFGGTWTKIKDGVGTFVTVTIPALGQSIIDGLITSVKNGSTALGNAVWQMIKDAVASAIASLGGGGGGGTGTGSAAPRLSAQHLGSSGPVSNNTSMRANVTIVAQPAQNVHQVAATAVKQINRQLTLRRT